LFACGNIGSSRPLESLQFLVDSYPDIDINSHVEPPSRTPSGGSNFLYLLGNIKWSDKYIRAAVKYTILYLLAKICRFITMQSTETMKKKEAVDAAKAEAEKKKKEAIDKADSKTGGAASAVGGFLKK
uniref:hypothetical protein n=1 Tax=Helicobacter typhlonius TaxID=76936 RepID=UPI002FE1B7C5